MLKKRIIPCLDIDNGRTVKGVNFVGLRDAGDPIELAKKYADMGADELVILNINAKNENRMKLYELVGNIASTINIPFTVGGGISSVNDALMLVRSGADKVSINSSAISCPELITDIAYRLGSQCVVVAVDARYSCKGWEVYSNGGRVATGIDLFDWIDEAVSRGAGEILFTSMDHDGTKGGFALDALSQLSSRISVPLIASGGAGEINHFFDLFSKTNVDGALAASIFHYGEIDIPILKSFLFEQNIPIRLI